uniref:Transmembrane protein n=1 Tax=Anopheles atroparvus TaxID=41427 RepID=A0AAG5DH58_ANOAO
MVFPIFYDSNVSHLRLPPPPFPRPPRAPPGLPLPPPPTFALGLFWPNDLPLLNRFWPCLLRNFSALIFTPPILRLSSLSIFCFLDASYRSFFTFLLRTSVRSRSKRVKFFCLFLRPPPPPDGRSSSPSSPVAVMRVGRLRILDSFACTIDTLRSSSRARSLACWLGCLFAAASALPFLLFFPSFFSPDAALSFIIFCRWYSTGSKSSSSPPLRLRFFASCRASRLAAIASSPASRSFSSRRSPFDWNHSRGCPSAFAAFGKPFSLRSVLVSCCSAWRSIFSVRSSASTLSISGSSVATLRRYLSMISVGMMRFFTGFTAFLMMSFTILRSCSPASDTDTPALPARAVRPTRWM